MVEEVDVETVTIIVCRDLRGSILIVIDQSFEGTSALREIGLDIVSCENDWIAQVVSETLLDEFVELATHANGYDQVGLGGLIWILLHTLDEELLDFRILFGFKLVLKLFHDLLAIATCAIVLTFVRGTGSVLEDVLAFVYANVDVFIERDSGHEVRGPILIVDIW